MKERVLDGNSGEAGGGSSEVQENTDAKETEPEKRSFDIGQDLRVLEDREVVEVRAVAVEVGSVMKETDPVVSGEVTKVSNDIDEGVGSDTK